MSYSAHDRERESSAAPLSIASQSLSGGRISFGQSAFPNTPPYPTSSYVPSRQVMDLFSAMLYPCHLTFWMQVP